LSYLGNMGDALFYSRKRFEISQDSTTLLLASCAIFHNCITLFIQLRKSIINLGILSLGNRIATGFHRWRIFLLPADKLRLRSI